MNMKKHKSNWFKGNSFVIALLTGSVLLLLLFVFVATLSGTWPSSEISAQIMAALAGAVVTAIITMFLLLGQTSSEEQKERNAKIFEEKLQIYNGFLQKLCDVVSNMEISKQEEIELEFQVARIAMHTSAESINQVSEQVSKIVENIKTYKNIDGGVLTELFQIADVFYKELYGQDYDYENYRSQTIDNFRTILQTDKDIRSYRKAQRNALQESYERKSGITLIERAKQIQSLIHLTADESNTTNDNGLEYEFYLNEKHGMDNFDSISANLFPDCRKQTYRLQVNVHADTECFLKVAEQVLNYDLLAPIERLNGMEMLLYKEIPFSESNEVIAKEMEILLTKIKDYRDKHYGI